MHRCYVTFCVTQGAAAASAPAQRWPAGSERQQPALLSAHLPPSHTCHPPNPHPFCTDGYPELRTLLAIGGVDMKTQADQVRNQGIHMVVATPGRLKDMLT